MNGLSADRFAEGAEEKRMALEPELSRRRLRSCSKDSGSGVGGM